MRKSFFGVLFITTLIPIVIHAQHIEHVEVRMDSLSNDVETLDRVVKQLSKFKVSAYLQGQYQYGEKDATLKVGDTNENPEEGFNRIGIRRGV
jgi:hypothetical protein